MPSQEMIKKIGVNPFAVCASRGLKQGTPEFERCVQSVTASAKKHMGKRIGMKKRKGK